MRKNDNNKVLTYFLCVFVDVGILSINKFSLSGTADEFISYVGLC